MICKSCENPILKSEKYFRPPHGGFRHEDCMTAKMRRNIECLQERISVLEAALRGLVTRLEQVHDSDQYRAVWQLWMIHHGPYSGPQYVKELESARKALDSK